MRNNGSGIIIPGHLFWKKFGKEILIILFVPFVVRRMYILSIWRFMRMKSAGKGKYMENVGWDVRVAASNFMIVLDCPVGLKSQNGYLRLRNRGSVSIKIPDLNSFLC